MQKQTSIFLLVLLALGCVAAVVVNNPNQGSGSGGQPPSQNLTNWSDYSTNMVGNAASNAAKSLMVWTNDNGTIRPISIIPVMVHEQIRIGTNALEFIPYFASSSNGLTVAFRATNGPQDSVIQQILEGPGSFTFAHAYTELTTNRVYVEMESENDDAGVLDTIAMSVGTNSPNAIVGRFGPWIEGRSGLASSAQYFRLMPFMSNPYVFKSAPLGESNILTVMNNTTNAFAISYGGNIWSQSGMATNVATFGFITTNLLSGQVYTNFAQRGHVVATTVLTNAAAGDFSAMALIVDQDGNGTWDTTNGPLSIQGVALSAAQYQLAGRLQPGARFAYTNQSAGPTPGSAVIQPGSCQWSRE